MFSESDLAELETWPYEDLGRSAFFMRQGYSYKPRDNRQFSTMSAGSQISRLMSRDIIVDVTGRLELNEREIESFDWWYFNSINQGNDHFKIKLLTGAGFNTVVAKFKKNGKGAASLKGLLYALPCSLVVSELPGLNLTAEQSKELSKHGASKLQKAHDILNAIVNETWEL